MTQELQALPRSAPCRQLSPRASIVSGCFAQLSRSLLSLILVDLQRFERLIRPYGCLRPLCQQAYLYLIRREALHF